MSTTILSAVRDWLDEEDLLDGYNVRFNRWTDEVENGAGGFALLRMAGPSGQTNRIMQERDVIIILVADPDGVFAAQGRAEEIATYMREPGAPSGVVRFNTLLNPVGPMYLANGRGAFEINVRVTV
jgi:hypothetical protein